MERQKCIYRVYVTYIWNLLYSIWIPLEIRIIPLGGVMGWKGTWGSSGCWSFSFTWSFGYLHGSIQFVKFVKLYIYDVYTFCGASLMAQWKRIHLQCRRHWFNSQVRKIPWRKKWLPTPVLFPCEIPWTEEPGELHSMELQNSQIQLSTQTTITCLKINKYIYIYIYIYITQNFLLLVPLTFWTS